MGFKNYIDSNKLLKKKSYYIKYNMINSKIETDNLLCISLHNNNIMKVLATVDTELLCGVLDFNGKKYNVDFEEFNKFAKFDKKFSFLNEYDKYPSYLHNYKSSSLLEFLFDYSSSNITYSFKNNNEYDLRKTNIEFFHKFHNEVNTKYKVIEYLQGHYSRLGTDSYVMKNPMWKVLNEKNEEQMLMYCEKDTLCTLSNESYAKIIEYEKKSNNGNKLTFYKQQSGYISSNIGLFIHQIIMGCYGNGKGTKVISVDHIDQDPLNNSFNNLRIATRLEQEQNSKGIKEDTKRCRKSNAKPLPEGITQDMMGKYVNYYHEYVDKEKTKSREFFKIEKHPKLDKHWMTSKSNKVSILEKLASVNKVVEDLKKDIYPINNESELPTHITIKVERNKPHIIFDKRTDDGKRLTLRMVLPDEYVLSEQLHIFKGKIKTKYDITIE